MIVTNYKKSLRGSGEAGKTTQQITHSSKVSHAQGKCYHGYYSLGAILSFGLKEGSLFSVCPLMKICGSQSCYLNSYNSILSMWWLKYYVVDYKGHHELNINLLTICYI